MSDLALQAAQDLRRLRAAQQARDERYQKRRLDIENRQREIEQDKRRLELQNEEAEQSRVEYEKMKNKVPSAPRPVGSPLFDVGESHRLSILGDPPLRFLCGFARNMLVRSMDRVGLPPAMMAFNEMGEQETNTRWQTAEVSMVEEGSYFRLAQPVGVNLWDIRDEMAHPMLPELFSLTVKAQMLRVKNIPLVYRPRVTWQNNSNLGDANPVLPGININSAMREIQESIRGAAITFGDVFREVGIKMIEFRSLQDQRREIEVGGRMMKVIQWVAHLPDRVQLEPIPNRQFQLFIDLRWFHRELDDENLNDFDLMGIIVKYAVKMLTHEDIGRKTVGCMLNTRIVNRRSIQKFRSAFDATGILANEAMMQMNQQGKVEMFVEREIHGEKFTIFNEGIPLPFQTALPDQLTNQVISKMIPGPPNAVRRTLTQSFDTLTVKRAHQLLLYTGAQSLGNGLGIISPAGYLMLWGIFLEIFVKFLQALIARGTPVTAFMFAWACRRFCSASDYDCLFRKGLGPHSIRMKFETILSAEHDQRQMNMYVLFSLFIRESRPFFNETVRELMSVVNDNIVAQGLLRAQNQIMVSQRPLNMASVNIVEPRQFKNSVNLMLPAGSNIKFKVIFSEMLTETTSRVSSAEIVQSPLKVDRSTSFSVHYFPSDFCSVEMLTEVLQTKMVEQIQAVLTRLGQVNLDLKQRSIIGWRFFMGFQFARMEQREPHRWEASYRTSGFNITLLDIKRNHSPDTDFPIFFQKVIIESHARKSGQLGAPQFRVEQQKLRPPKTRDDIRDWGVVAEIVQTMSTETIMEMAALGWTISGPDDIIQPQQPDYYIRSLTVFNMPLYAPGTSMLPIKAELRYAPCTDFNLSHVKQLLGEDYARDREATRSGFDMGFNIDGAMSEMQINQLINCISVTAWTVGAAFIQMMVPPERQFQSKFELSVKIRNLMTSNKMNSMSQMLSVLRKFLNDSDDTHQAPLTIFFVEGCQLTFFDLKQSNHQRFLRSFLTADEEWNWIPITCVLSGSNAHCFRSTLGQVRQCIQTVARSDLRGYKHKRRLHTGFALSPVQPFVQKAPQMSEDEIVDDIMGNVWTLDIETTNSIDHPMEPYCIIIHNGHTVMFQSMNDPTVVKIQFMEYLQSLKKTRTHKSSSMIWYAHNGARFDWVVLMREILQVFPDMKVFGRLTDAKYCIIPSINLKLADFYLLVSDSLQNISKSFGVTDTQLECEQIKDVESFDDLTTAQRKKIYEYCVQDCQCLWQCIEKFVYKVVQLLDADKPIKQNIVLPPTSSKLAINMICAKFLKKPILGTVSLDIDEIQVSAYYGGVTQVFNFKQQLDVKYVDVNSLYPAAMSEVKVQLAPAAKHHVYLLQWRLGRKTSELMPDNLYMVDMFEWKPRTISMFPVRTKQGGLCYPRVSHTPSWRCGSEIIAAAQSGMLQQLRISKELSYPNVEPVPVFAQYIKKIYKQKAEAGDDEVLRTLLKLLLNQAYGKLAEKGHPIRLVVPFGSVINDPTIMNRVVETDLNAALLDDIINKREDVNLLLNTYYGNDQQSTKTRTKYVPQLISVNRVDKKQQFLQLVFQPSPTDVQRIGFLKRISLQVTGRARAIMTRALTALYQVFKDTLTENVFYMDTDSFFLSREAFNILEERGFIDQKELGKFKDEFPDPCVIEYAKFFAAKVYLFKTTTKGWKYKFKGVQKSTFAERSDDENFRFFQNVLNPNHIQKVAQEAWKRNFAKIQIESIWKETVAKTRRKVGQDGNSEMFQTLEEFQAHNVSNRLAFDHDQLEFKYIRID